MLIFLKKYELFILNVVLVMIMFVVFVCTIELGWIIIKDLYFNPPRFLLAIADIKEIFGFFLLLLIGLELLETIKVYLIHQVIRVEIILEVALIAIARKVIILDFEKFDGFIALAMGGLILSIAAAFYIFRKRAVQKA